MIYAIMIVSIVLALCISTLVTQSWGWGLLTWGITGLGCLCYALWSGYTQHKTNKHKHILTQCTIVSIIRLGIGIISLGRLRNYHSHCSQTPTMIQGDAVVDRIHDAGKSVVVNQGDYYRIYRSSDPLQPGQRISLQASTQALQTCINTYTHRDSGWMKLQRWLQGGDFDYDRWLVMKGIDGYIQGKHTIVESHITTPATMDRVRTKVMSNITQLFDDDRSAGWVAGSLIGSKDLIQESDYDLLIGSGLVHLIVVSGGNLALVIVILSTLLFWVPLYLRYSIIVVGLLWYVALVGTDSSVLRALIMALVTIGGIILGRKWSFAGTVSLACTILLLYNPLMIYDVGLRLSLSAVIGIYVSYQWLTRLTYERSKSKLIQRGRQIILVIGASIGAWLGTLPVLVWQFGSANLSSVIANSIVGIIASITTISELIVLGLQAIIPNTLVISRGVRCIEKLVGFIYRVAQWTVDGGLWIGVSDGKGLVIIVASVMTLFTIGYHWMKHKRIDYLLETETI